MGGRKNMDIEQLRKELLDEIYAGSFAGGLPAMLLDEDRIRNADEAELIELPVNTGF